MRFLVIEDNPKMAEIVRRTLADQTYNVDVANSGFGGEELAVTGTYDGIVLDLMLPDHDGLQVCRNVRRRGIATPILMLTALSSTEHKVDGLDAGADDYLTKPFEAEELVARVRAMLRRARTSDGVVLKHDDLEMDLTTRRVHRGQEAVRLSSKEFALLEYFLRNPHRVLTRSMIAEHVWDMALEDESNVIEVYVSRLRNKVDKAFDRKLIHTVIGTGYVMSMDGAPA